MKQLLAATVLLICTLSAHAAGFQSLDIPGPRGKPISLAIWYPSAAPVQARSMGTDSQDVASHGAVDGKGLPLVVITHGNGGFKYSHLDTALALADAGFVVVALTHPGDNYADQSEATDMLERPKHIVAALDYMLGAWPQKSHLAPSRIGIFGFSSGGFTALVSIGGQPDMGKVFTHCAAHPGHYACMLLASRGEQAGRAPMAVTAPMHEQRIRAAVIVAPALGFTFDAAALSKVEMPVQLWRAEDDEILPHPWYAEHVRLALPRNSDYHVVPRAGHFDFLAPCTAKLAAMAPRICASLQGFDRSAFHRRFNAEVVKHFKKFL